MKLRIFEKFDNIKKYLKDLKSLNITKIEDLKNIEKYYSASMIEFNILNDFFVLGDEIIDEFDFEIAQNYREIFEVLEKNSIISEKELYFCKDLVYLRNKLAHEYDRIKKKEVFELVEKVNKVETIATKIIAQIKK